MPFIRARVASIEPHGSEKTKVVVRCALVSIDPKQKLTVTPKLFEQEEEPSSYADRIEFYGKGKPLVNVGDSVKIEFT